MCSMNLGEFIHDIFLKSTLTIIKYQKKYKAGNKKNKKKSTQTFKDAKNSHLLSQLSILCFFEEHDIVLSNKNQ